MAIADLPGGVASAKIVSADMSLCNDKKYYLVLSYMYADMAMWVLWLFITNGDSLGKAECNKGQLYRWPRCLMYHQ